jgi:hypothetical protein
VLELVKPLSAARRRVDQGGQLRRDEPGHCGPARAGDLGSGGSCAVAAVSIRVPHAIAGARDFLERPPGRDAPGLALDDRGAAGRGGLVTLLDEEPAAVVIAAAPAGADPHERPPTGELFALQRELQRAGAVGLVRIADGLPGAAIPQKDGAAAVLSLGDDALEAAVVEGMILDVHREAFVPRVEARPLRDRPALEDAFELESKIVVEPRSRVLLHDERPLPFARLIGHLTRGLRSLLEVAFALILAEPHGPILTKSHPRR